MDENSFNAMRGVSKHERVDHELYNDPNAKSKSKKRKSVNGEPVKQDNENNYYKIICRDNGVGMKHENIPNMLGRVLAGFKYGVRQTRGKFGLGAKMALIWAKKSTGMPIQVKSAYSMQADKTANNYSTCELDIDIYKNEPNVLSHVQRPNDVIGWKGTELTVVIGGNWTRYKSRVIQYLQQLAIITPYAAFELKYKCTFNANKDLNIRYDRRSEQMPPLAKEVKHHPSALNDLLMKQLIDHSKYKKLDKFLIHDLSNITAPLAKRVIAELGPPFKADMIAKSLTTKQVHRMVSLFKQLEFKPPDGVCLSPAGEYNLRLGVLKELDPTMIATSTEPAAVFEGHPFIVEAAVSLGGKNVREGLNIYRFANRRQGVARFVIGPDERVERVFHPCWPYMCSRGY